MTAERHADRTALRRALRELYPWLERTDAGPRAVEAGECDRCRREARLVPTCGPVRWGSLGRRCASAVGLDAWCEGHRQEGRERLAWLRRLPPEADEVARLWWVATGEVRLDPELLAATSALPGRVRAAVTASRRPPPRHGGAP